MLFPARTVDVTPTARLSEAVRPSVDWLQLTWIGWVGFSVALLCKTIVSPLKHTTFPLFVDATRLWWSSGQPYVAFSFEYRYSPTFLAAFTPFAVLPYTIGGMIWSLANVVLLIYAMRQLMQHLLLRRWNPLQQSVFLAIVLLISVRSLWAAQCNTMIVSLGCLAAVVVVQQRWGMAALWLSIPVYIKVWPIALLMLMVACWPRQLLGRTIAVMVGLALFPFLCQHPQYVMEQYRDWIIGLSGPMQARHIYRDAWTIWEFVAPPVQPRLYVVLQLVTAFGTLVYCLQHAWANEDNRRTAIGVLGVWTVWQLVFGPGTERNTFCLIAPFAAWALITAFESHRGRWLISAGGLMVILFSFGIFERKLDKLTSGVVMALPIGVLLIGLWFAIYARPSRFNKLMRQKAALL